ncbi:hypothetical protein EYF80_025017 [Liparis tanakae]|uniref:Uncharacterized protein n=1 Tax=Liparis tanakae TaxID=230148 RepID=A0A4Z2HGI5_9TELE|nr:hypothetical protein EYF80_025017 [Liparis tanakae]
MATIPSGDVMAQVSNVSSVHQDRCRGQPAQLPPPPYPPGLNTSTCTVVVFEVQHLTELQEWTERLQEGTDKETKRKGRGGEEEVVGRGMSHHQFIQKMGGGGEGGGGGMLALTHMQASRRTLEMMVQREMLPWMAADSAPMASTPTRSASEPNAGPVWHYATEHQSNSANPGWGWHFRSRMGQSRTGQDGTRKGTTVACEGTGNSNWGTVLEAEQDTHQRLVRYEESLVRTSEGVQLHRAYKCSSGPDDRWTETSEDKQMCRDPDLIRDPTPPQPSNNTQRQRRRVW